LTAAQIGGDGGPAELDGADGDPRRRQPQVDVDAAETLDRERLAVPAALAISRTVEM
jgi:hypothetical protein